jgi:hypothetical protein
MASGEKKLTILNSYIGSLPDDALLYVVIDGVSYKTTKSALLAGIGGGTTPNFQEVTDVEAVTTNAVTINSGGGDNMIFDEGTGGINQGGGEFGTQYESNGGLGNDRIILNAKGLSVLNASGSEETKYSKDKITVNGVDFPLPTGSSSPLATMANIPTINENYKGTYTSLSALETAHPTAALGNYAVVDAGAGNDAVQYIWDAQDGWVSAGSTSIATTDALTEGSTNLYFTVARVLASALSGLSLSDGSDVTSANTVLQAFGKLQKQLTDVRAAKADKSCWMSQSTPRTLDNTTALQKIFNVGTSGNGSKPVVAGKRYKVTGWAVFSALSSSSKTIGVGFLGTATASYISGTGVGVVNANAATASVNQITSFNTSNVITAGSANTAGKIFFECEFICTGSGNLIPSVAFTASTTGMQVDSAFCFIDEVGASTDTGSSDII